MNPDFRDMLSEFVSAEVQFLLIGAHALAAHGLPRATGDLDLWVRCGKENADRIMTALRRFGAPLADVSAADFLTPSMVVQFGVVPYRIDLITLIDAVDFDEAWTNRIYAEIDGLSIPVIGREELIRNKRSTGRPKDLADVHTLENRR